MKFHSEKNLINQHEMFTKIRYKNNNNFIITNFSMKYHNIKIGSLRYIYNLLLLQETVLLESYIFHKDL